jgi:hypothetical protein
LDIANGATDKQIAARNALSRSAVQRHRRDLGLANATAVAATKSAAFQALAALRSADEVGAAYSSIAERIDTIASRAEAEGSLAVALIGLRELRSTVTAQAALAGHTGASAQVQVNTQVNVDLATAVRELIAAIRPDADALTRRGRRTQLSEDCAMQRLCLIALVLISTAIVSAAQNDPSDAPTKRFAEQPAA